MTSAALALLVSLSSATVPELDDFMTRFRESREPVAVLQAEYTEKNITPDETFFAEGTLLYTRPRRILRTTHYPYDAAVLIDGTTSYQYEPEVRQLVIHELADAPEADILFFGFDSDISRLRQSYDITLFALEDHPLGELGMELMPKAGSEAEELFSKAMLYLRDDNLLPYRIQLVFDEESQLVVEMSDYTINGVVAPEDTQIEAAPGTTIIRNDEIVREVGEVAERLPEPVSIVATAPPASESKQEPDDTVSVVPLDDPALEEAGEPTE